MKTVLCFGDSNTWGVNLNSGGRLAPEMRWCGVLRERLGAGYAVIEEGLSGRTTAYDDPQSAYRSGGDYLPPCLETHSPIDLVIIMLGTNDLKNRLGLSAGDIAFGMEKLLGMIQKSEAGRAGSSPKVLLLSPPHVSPAVVYDDFFGMQEKSKQLGALYERLAQKYGCSFFDVSTIVDVSDLPDGLHLGAAAHAMLGNKLADIVTGIFE